MIAAVGSILLAAGAPATATGDTAEPTVTVGSGRLIGSRENGVAVFRGIPYAAPPVGDRRWRPPAPPLDWDGVRRATSAGPACLQKTARQDPERALRDAPQSEDCLTLNVWSAAKHGAGAPVIVWVHGGGFRFGAGSLSTYDGGEWARRGAVVVTFNYRLGLFGTFAHQSVHGGGEADGNFGLLDTIAMLGWVRDNIASFGGDPGRVTLAGESAGGATVAYLMASPLARGLFSAAIIESGSLSLPEYSRAKAEAVAARLAETLGTHDAAALRALPAAAIRDVVAEPADTMPFIDGTIIREPMRAAFEAGRVEAIPLLIGSNDAEAGFFPAPYWQGQPAEIGERHWRQLAELCPVPDSERCTIQIASERFAGVNGRAIARAASRAAPVWVYRFAWTPAADRATSPVAIHTAEIPYVFGTVKADAESAKLASSLADRWIAFATTRDPLLVRGDWPRFQGGADERVLLIGPDSVHVGANPAGPLLDAIDALALSPKP